MLALAAAPSASVALVVTRSATMGVASGIAVATGIVLGDLVFVMLAILGLSTIAEAMGGLFIVIKYLGAIYLLWLGFSLLKMQGSTSHTIGDAHPGASLITSFFAGFALTLGDLKAVFFYLSLFPAFIDLNALEAGDILLIVLITVASVGGVKVFYALSAAKIAALTKGIKLQNIARRIAGGIMLGAGSYIIAKT